MTRTELSSIGCLPHRSPSRCPTSPRPSRRSSRPACCTTASWLAWLRHIHCQPHLCRRTIRIQLSSIGCLRRRSPSRCPTSPDSSYRSRRPACCTPLCQRMIHIQLSSIGCHRHRSPSKFPSCSPPTLTDCNGLPAWRLAPDQACLGSPTTALRAGAPAVFHPAIPLTSVRVAILSCGRTGFCARAVVNSLAIQVRLALDGARLRPRVAGASPAIGHAGLRVARLRAVWLGPCACAVAHNYAQRRHALDCPPSGATTAGLRAGAPRALAPAIGHAGLRIARLRAVWLGLCACAVAHNYAQRRHALNCPRSSASSTAR
eukprot:scaffold598_cov235-Prasinococcus_capsulatus_cf.AAC.2